MSAVATPAVSDAFYRTALTTCVICVLLILGITIYLVFGRVHDSATLTGQKSAVARQDCARVISAEQNDVIRARDNLGWQGLLAVAQNDNATLGALEPKLRDAITDVQKLEPLQHEVDRRCPKA